MSRASLAWVVCAGALGCSNPEPVPDSTGSSATAAAPIGTGAASTSAGATPTATATARPGQVRLVNRSGDELTFTHDCVRCLDFLSASTRTGVSGSLGLGREGYCTCTCPEAGVKDWACAECEPPAVERFTLGPGEERSVPWDGWLRSVVRQDDNVCERLIAPLGPHVIVACDESKQHCAAATVELPASAPVVLELGASPRRDRCPLSDELLHRGAAIAMATMDHGGVAPERRAACRPKAARCVDASGLADALAQAAKEPCSHLVIPRGIAIEVLTHVPLPGGQSGGERYSVWTDPFGVDVTRVQYSQ